MISKSSVSNGGTRVYQFLDVAGGVLLEVGLRPPDIQQSLYVGGASL